MRRFKGFWRLTLLSLALTRSAVAADECAPGCPACAQMRQQVQTLLNQGRHDEARSIAKEQLKANPSNTNAREIIEAIDKAEVKKLQETWKKEDSVAASLRAVVVQKTSIRIGDSVAFIQAQQALIENKTATGGGLAPYDTASKEKAAQPINSTFPIENPKMKSQLDELRKDRGALESGIRELYRKLMVANDPNERSNVMKDIDKKTKEKGSIEIKMLDLRVKPHHEEEKKP